MNRLVGLTISGADNGVTPADLVDFAREAPFVEWGILVSETRMGTPRYPSREWLRVLGQAMEVARLADVPRPRLSLHVCGRWARDILAGVENATTPVTALTTLAPFQRMQINGGSVGDDQVAADLGERLPQVPDGGEIIFQIGSHRRTRALDLARAAGAPCSALLDASGGRGETPDLWPAPIPGVKCGWAGGLAPWNLAAEVLRMQHADTHDGQPVDFWVDMETGARTSDVWDWNKVRAAVAAVAPMIETSR